MKKSILELKNAKKLTRDQMKSVVGGIGDPVNPDLSKCGCDCAGRVTGPSYCIRYIACPQVYNCLD